MSNNTVNEQNQTAEKKKRSKKPLAALVLCALLALGGYGANQVFNKDNDEKVADRVADKEKITIAVVNETVKVNDKVETLAADQSWKAWLEDYFSKKDMSKTEVVVNYYYGNDDITKAIKDALSELKINATEEKSAGQ